METPQDNSQHPMRNAVRFPLRLPVRLEVEGVPVDAETKDISATGVLFTTQQRLNVNDHLAWTLRMPGEVMGGEDVTVSCQGRVVWQAPTLVGRQAGVVIDAYQWGDR